MGNLFSTTKYEKFYPMDYYPSDYTGLPPLEDGTTLTHTGYIKELEDEIRKLKKELISLKAPKN